MISRLFVAGLRPAPLIMAFMLAACSSFSFSPKELPKIDENLFPANYRDAVLTLVKSTQSFDPTNIREASISEPALKPVAVSGAGVTRYVVCARFNPRNFSRQYIGLTEYVAYFYAGNINQFVKATGDICAGASYRPFPELEKICLGDKCA